MLKIERLRKEALESCKFRGHTMKSFSRRYRYWWNSECRVCGMYVDINDNPLPNEIDISGEAVALHCTGPRLKYVGFASAEASSMDLYSKMKNQLKGKEDVGK